MSKACQEIQQCDMGYAGDIRNTQGNKLLGRLWRVVATGFVFVVFGLGALVISVSVFPLLRLSAWHARGARPRIQRAMQLTFKAYIGLMRVVGLLTYEVHHAERLRAPGQLVIANHPSLIDVVFLISLMPSVECIVKRGLWRNPFLRWPVSWAGYIPNSNGEKLVQDCAATLRRGNSLLVFPEGTRTVPGEKLRLQRGAAHIALAAQVPILPVTITVSEPTLTKLHPWYRVPGERPHFCIKVGEHWSPSVYYPTGVVTKPLDCHVERTTTGLAARQLTDRFVRYYSAVEEGNLRWPI